MRLFFAVKVPEEQRLASARLAQEIRAKTPPDLKIGWVRSEHMHLTLVFMAKTAPERLQAVREAGRIVCAKTSAIEIGLKGLGAFPSFESPQVLWIGLSKGAEALKELSRNLRTELKGADISFDEKDFLPHLTLARNKGMQRPQAKAFALPEGPAQDLGSWTSSSIVLIESRLTPMGPQYREESEIPFKTT